MNIEVKSSKQAKSLETTMGQKNNSNQGPVKWSYKKELIFIKNSDEQVT
jgi:hypothetical protein